MVIPDEKIQELNEKINIVEIVSDYVTLKKQGGRYFGLCPFHQERTPSFSVSADKNVYYCFGCQKGGSMFNFLMEIEKLSFVESVKKVAEKAGVDLPQNNSVFAEDSRRSKIQEVYNRMTKTFHYLLMEGKQSVHAKEYLKSRNISDEMVREFMLGYHPGNSDWLYNFLLKHKYSEEFLEHTGFFSKKYRKYSLFTDRLLFPIINAQGNTIAFGGRLLSGEGPKYINSPETDIFKKKSALFGMRTALSEIRNKDEIILTEGYFDVIACYSAGIKNAVAPLGTSFTEGQAHMMKRYASRAIIFFDGDAAGISAAKKASILMEKTGIDSKVVSLPSGQDPADILEKEGVEALNNVLKYPISSFEYLVKKYAAEFDLDTPKGKESVVRALQPYIEAIESEVKREGCFRILADFLDIDQQAIISDFRKGLKRINEGKQKLSQKESFGEKRQISSELFLLLSVIVNRSSFGYVRSMLSEEDISDKRAKELYIALEECYRREEDSIDLLLEKIDDKELCTLIAEKISSEEFSINPEEMVKDTVRSIRQEILEEKRKSVERRLKAAEKGKSDTVQDLLFEKIYLDEELKKLRVKKI